MGIGMKILRCWCSTPSGNKLFAINLPFTTKQYKVDNIANFVYYGKIRLFVLETSLPIQRSNQWRIQNLQKGVQQLIILQTCCRKLHRKNQGVKEFHMLARINCYCKIMVFSPFELRSIIVNHPMVTNVVALSNI